MKIQNCNFVTGKNCAIYYYFDKRLNGIFILDIVQIDAKVALYKLVKDFVQNAVPGHPIYFIGSNLGYLKNHAILHKIVNGKQVYKYVPRY